MVNDMKVNLIKVVNMEKENIITSKDSCISEIGKIMLRMDLDSIFTKMEPDTMDNSKTT